MAQQSGIFVVSLDLELFWGVRDKKTIAGYSENLLGVRAVVPALLELFKKYSIHATWATVGFLFFETREELMSGLPARIPTYVNRRLSPYEDLASTGYNEEEDPFHYAPSLIRMISSLPHQEIGTHTFSHYYCLEEGQDAGAFRADLEAAIRAAGKRGLNLESLVFPRNQYSSESIAVCKDMGIKCYRGNEKSWIYEPRSREKESLLRRGLRLLDAYINLSGRNCYSPDAMDRNYPVNIPSSRFLRPCSRTLKALEPIRLRRILSDLTCAAKKGLVYHLWWHPHNFGVNLRDHLSFLEKILAHYRILQSLYGIESLNMGELSKWLVEAAQINGKTR